MTPPAKPATLTPEQSELIDEIKAAQEQSGLAEGPFAKRYLGFSPSKWSRIQSGEYFSLIDKPEKLVAQLREKLGGYKMETNLAARFNGRPLVETDAVTEVRQSLKDCAAKPLSDPVRCTIFQAQTGGGKSFLCSHLRNEEPATTFVVEARECWKKSYFHCIQDICRACKVSAGDTNFPTELETRLIARLSERRYRLLIDEGEYFGPQALNLLKLLLNKTETVILVAVIPAAYERWNRSSSHEAGQIRRRTHRVVRAYECSNEVVEEMLKKSALNGSTEEAADRIARAADKFGGYDIARRICNRVIQSGAKRMTSKEDNEPTVEKCILEVGEILGGIVL